MSDIVFQYFSTIAFLYQAILPEASKLVTDFEISMQNNDKTKP